MDKEKYVYMGEKLIGKKISHLVIQCISNAMNWIEDDIIFDQMIMKTFGSFELNSRTLNF